MEDDGGYNRDCIVNTKNLEECNILSILFILIYYRV